MKDLYPTFSNQYNKTYNIRLNTLRPLINTKEDIKLCNKIRDINEFTDECMIIGILFISSDLKTTIFNPKKETTILSDKIKYYLEDETGRIELVIHDLVNNFISTGMILGFKGKINLNKFIASEIIFPEKNNLHNRNNLHNLENLNNLHNRNNLNNFINLDNRNNLNSKGNIKEEENCKKDNKIAFISNIDISKNNKNKEDIKVICDYLIMNHITQICIFGPFFQEDFDYFKSFIENLNIEILLIPELLDFNCQTYPLLPVHKKLFEKNILSTENPSIINLRNKSFVLFSYGIIEDLLKYLPKSSTDLYKYNLIKIIKGCLNSRLLCPSGPDTLPIIPYTKDELFFIETPVDYFIIPNCVEIIFDNYDNTFILGLPKFRDTNQLIILDIFNTNYEVIEFN